MTAEPLDLDLDIAPFLEGGVGDIMCKAAAEYADTFVLTTEGDDHTPTEFERWLLDDFFAGLISDERFFGPVRQLISSARELSTLKAVAERIVSRKPNPTTGQRIVLEVDVLALEATLSPSDAGGGL